MATDPNREWIEAHHQLTEAQEEQRRWQDRYFSVSQVQPGQPLKTGEPITVEAMAEIEDIERRIDAAQERYRAAWRGLRGE